MKTLTTGCVLALAAIVTTGCVSKGRYDEAVAQTRTTRAEIAKKDVALAQMSTDLEQRRADIAQMSTDLEQRGAEIAKLRRELDGLTRSSESARSVSGARISNLQARIAALEAAQTAAEARAALYKDLSLRLKRQIDDGDLAIVIRDGRMVLQLPNDVLFDTGRTELKPAGKKALVAVADVMRMMPERSFQIAGHTDNVPIHNDQFASNWELSSGRALHVVHFLIDKGVTPTMLSAAGYADVDPLGSNATPEGKRKNRRTEISLQPNIDELVKIPQ